MGSVVTAIQNLGVEVEHIPGGCTYLCQPVDVGVNKPFKKLIRDKWEQWMISEGIVHGTTSPPPPHKETNCRMDIACKEPYQSPNYSKVVATW